MHFQYVDSICKLPKIGSIDWMWNSTNRREMTTNIRRTSFSVNAMFRLWSLNFIRCNSHYLLEISTTVDWELNVVEILTNSIRLIIHIQFDHRWSWLGGKIWALNSHRKAFCIENDAYANHETDYIDGYYCSIWQFNNSL